MTCEYCIYAIDGDEANRKRILFCYKREKTLSASNKCKDLEFTPISVITGKEYKPRRKKETDGIQERMDL